MKYYSFLFYFCVLINSVLALDVPFLSGRVIDEVGILSVESKTKLENQLKEHEKKTTNQVVVLIISSLEGEVLEEYSLKVASTWKLGQKGKDNGVLLLIAKDDRKLRIEVGYGLEGTLTDALCNRIIRNEITPAFKQGNFASGVKEGVNAILNSIQGTYTEVAKKETNFTDYLDLTNIGFSTLTSISFGVFEFVFMIPFLFAAAFTPYIGWILYFFLMPFIGLSFAPFGILFLPIYIVAMFVFKIYLGFFPNGKKLREKYVAKFVAMRSGSGGSSGFSGGSRGGGGFSGGGGSFGGGGSSGSW